MSPTKRRARAPFALLLLAGLVAGCPSGDDAGSRLPRTGDPAPAFTLEALEGSGSVALGDLVGKPVVINFWATWCPPCVQELPSIQALAERFAERGVAVYAVSVDSDPPATIRSFLEARQLSIDVLLDPGGATARSYGTFRFPETFLLDRQGRIARKYVGAHDWTEEIYAQAIEELLAPPTGDAT